MKPDRTNLYREIAGIRDIDIHFAEFARRLGDGSEELFQAALLLSNAAGRLNPALDLKTVSEKFINQCLGDKTLSNRSDIALPEYVRWVQILKDEKNSNIVGKPGEKRPIIMDEAGFVYLYRFFEYERAIARAVINRSISPELPGKPDSRLLKILFESNRENKFDIDYQEVSLFAALNSKFLVITGGPGTGKTTTVANLLVALLDQEPELQIDLVAPTGKAADRMVKSIGRTTIKLERKGVPVSLLQKIPSRSRTIHRFLDYHPDYGFRYNRNNPQTSGLLVVDEASMVSLPLMHSLFEALEDSCRVVLLGDRDQLDSVETGSVFGVLANKRFINRYSKEFKQNFQKNCRSSLSPETLQTIKPHDILTDRVVRLEHSYRFKSSSGIGVLSCMINRMEREEDIESIVYFLNNLSLNPQSAEIFSETGSPMPEKGSFDDISYGFPLSEKEFKKRLMKNVREGLYVYLDLIKELARSPITEEKVISVLDTFDNHRILCAVHHGPYGTKHINRIICDSLFREKDSKHFHGQALMVTKNDYSKNLFNGDIGIVLKDEHGQLYAWFRGEGEKTRKVSCHALPEHTTAFAMTVHKSQGSEFGHLLLILPLQPVKILSKELVYTGITRAVESLSIWATDTVMKMALATGATRTSGLEEKILSQTVYQ